jgi:hypothetical protein
MGAKIQAFDIFQTPLSSHYPLPLLGSCIFADFVYIINLPRRKLPIEVGGGNGKARRALFYVLKGLCHEMNIF